MTLSDIQDDDPLNESSIHLLHKVGQLATEIFADEVGNSGLTSRQFAVLSVVGRHLDLSQTDLVDVTGIDRSTLADIVRRMLKKGLLSRRRTEADQRAYAIRLSPEGQSIFDEYKPNAARADTRILAAIPIETREAFMRALKAIISSKGDGNNGTDAHGRDGAISNSQTGANRQGQDPDASQHQKFG